MGEEKKTRKTRSPSFPYISLQKAIDFVEVLYEEEQTTEIPQIVAKQHLGYTKKSSSGDRAVAALEKYGLIDRDIQENTLEVSDRALDIMLTEKEDPQYQEAIKKAASSPQIYQETLEHFNGNIPSEANLKHYLIRTKNFNPKSVDKFIKEFIETQDFKDYVVSEGLNGTEQIEESEENKDKAEEESTSSPSAHQPKTQEPNKHTDEDKPTFYADFGNDNYLKIEMGSRVSKSLFEEVIQQYFKISKHSFVKKDED